MEYKFKVGDEVITYDHYKGTVIYIDSTDVDYPYKVDYVDDWDWYAERNLESIKTASEPSEALDATQVSTEGKQAVVEAPVTSEGVKFDSDKLQWWYLWQFLPELEQVAYVLQYGDKKYPAEDGSNWKRLDNLERRASSAAMRHLSAYLQDDKLDKETTKSHLAHCITNLLFLMYNDRNQTKGETK